MVLSNALAYEADGLIQIGVPAVGHFLHHNQPLLALKLHGESRATAGMQYRITAFNSKLDVLRIVVLATNNQQVFQASGNE